MPSVLTPIEQSFLHIDSPTTSQAIGVYCTLDSYPDIEKVRGKMEELSARFPRMRQIVVERRQRRWEETNRFSFEQHFNAKTTEASSGPADYLSHAGKYFEKNFDFGRPLWDCTIFGNPNQKDLPASLLFRVHHSFADGLGGLAFFEAFCDEPEAQEASEGPQQITRRGEATSFHSPIGAIKVGASLLRLLSEHSHPRKSSPILGSNSSQRLLTIGDVSLEDIKKIRRQANCSLNDVVLTLVSRALQQYLREHYLAVDNVRAIMPVNMRPAHKRDALGNYMTAVGVTLPLLEDDLSLQLQLINKEVNNLKSSGGFGAYALLSRITSRLPANLQREICQRQAQKTHFICTNMPFKRSKLSFGGASISSIYPLAALLHGHGIAVGFLSYAEKLHVAIVSDPAILTTPESLVLKIKEAVNEIKSAVGVK